MTTPRTAIVTGASRGIGAAIALSLGEAGIRAALLARSLEPLADIARRAGSASFAVPCDVTDDLSVDRAVSVIRSRLGGAPDIIVSNAGLFTIRAFEDTPAADFDRMLATNLRAPFRLVSAFLPDMKARGAGHIVTIGSVADRHIFAGNAAYSATKYGQRALHEVLRAETRGTGIRTTLVSPASVDTDIWEPIQYLDTDERPDRSGMLPPEAVSAAVMFALDQPAQVNIDELRLSRS